MNDEAEPERFTSLTSTWRPARCPFASELHVIDEPKPQRRRHSILSIDLGPALEKLRSMGELPIKSFATAVAGFGLVLRGSHYKVDLTLPAVAELAEASRGTDESGYRSEFIELVRKAQSFARPHAAGPPCGL